jgi:hypothetical protein
LSVYLGMLPFEKRLVLNDRPSQVVFCRHADKLSCRHANKLSCAVPWLFNQDELALMDFLKFTLHATA